MSIPTTYRGRLFRSRLEARWAAFFDLAGWVHEYEPFDLPGWIPDFALYGKKQEILVEVKPHSKLVEFHTKRIESAMARSAKAGLEILLLGASVWPESEDVAGPFIGWLGERIDQDFAYTYEIAPFNTYGGLGFCSNWGSYENRITGQYGGGYTFPPRWCVVLELWNRAGNAVQWKSPRQLRSA